MFPVSDYKKQIDKFYCLLESCRDVAETVSTAYDWTVRDNVAHLIDSASNNHQRFIRLQLKDKLIFPGYDADNWVNASAVGSMEYDSLIELWKLYNYYLLNIISNIKPEALLNCWNTDGNSFSLKFLVEDYFVHMKIHEEMVTKIIHSINS